MNRPYIICHILSALNGKISGSFMGAESNRQMGREYAAIRNAWLYGTTTTKEFTDSGFRYIPQKIIQFLQEISLRKKMPNFIMFPSIQRVKSDGSPEPVAVPDARMLM